MSDTATMNPTDHPDYAVGTWTLDPMHSELTFSVRHLAISKVRGSFEKFEVTAVTHEDPSQNTISATVDIASVNTGVEARDEHLRTSDFFLAEEHPTMEFRSTSIALAGEDLTIEGELTMRGVTKPVTLKGELGGVIVDGYGQTKVGASATTTINRHDFGVSWNAALEAGGMTLGDDVKIAIEVQLVLGS